MVLLTMTPTILGALTKVQRLHDDDEPRADKESSTKSISEPSLLQPEIGKPISHNQILTLSKQLKANSLEPYHLDILLCSSKVYIPPPRPKPEPVSDSQTTTSRGLIYKTAHNLQHRHQNTKPSWPDSAATKKPAPMPL
jgi:hypothetical protein